ncbi:MAG: Hsp20/alpha crystallin family protein [Desulfuromonas sp.]|nr:Hsp20/alpha crystallin family protein [Desulfuromonas sp.]
MSTATNLQPSNETYVTPAVDIYDNEQGVFFIADMPGIKRENLNIDIDKGLLTIDGWQDIATNAAPENGAENEKARHHYRRRFQLGNKFDSAQASATLECGVLKVHLPRLQAATPQRIEIQVA